MEVPGPPRRRLCGLAAIEAALLSEEPVRLLLVAAENTDPNVEALIALARSRGVALWQGSEGDLRRMSPTRRAERAIALLGPQPESGLGDVLAGDGAIWLLHRAAYPSNVGFAIRTAEVSGAAAIVVDAAFNHAQRARARHVGMGADRVMPVLWESSSAVLDGARAHGRRVVALEDVGTLAPWDVDLTGRVVLMVGNERDGIAPELLARCESVIALPMAGFVPSYNVQAALSAVALERLRQLAARARTPAGQ